VSIEGPSKDDENDEGDDWLEMPDPAPPEQIAAAYGEGVHRTKGEPIEGRAGARIETCPLDPGWRLWDMFSTRERDFRWLTPAESDRCRAARTVIPEKHVGLVALEWEIAPDDARYQPMTPEESGSPDWKYADGYPRHHHAVTSINDHTIHIDRVDVSKYGPGRSVREFRIFVDRELAGRGGHCGCSLGFGGGDLPAVARIDSDLVVTVDAVAGEQLPVVELWRIRQAHGEQ
jgi:hypothetical protein